MTQRLSRQFSGLAKISSWFHGLPQRDQLALKWMMVAFVVFFIYFVVWQPTQSYLDKGRNEAERAYSELVWMKENELRAKQFAQQNRPADSQDQLAGQSLLSVVSSTAQRFKVELQRFEPRGEDRVNVWLDSVSFNQMMQWIGELDASYGVRVEQITVDKADLSGTVSARMSFQI